MMFNCPRLNGPKPVRSSVAWARWSIQFSAVVKQKSRPWSQQAGEGS
jgi:hypothetical protein